MPTNAVPTWDETEALPTWDSTTEIKADSPKWQDTTSETAPALGKEINIAGVEAARSRYANEGPASGTAKPSTPNLSGVTPAVTIPESAFPGGTAQRIIDRANTPEELAKTKAIQTPLISIPRLTEEETSWFYEEALPDQVKVLQGIHNGIADLVEGATTLESFALVPYLAVPGGAGTAIKGLIAADMALGAVGMVPQIQEAIQKGDLAESVRLSGVFGAQSLMALGLGKSTVKGIREAATKTPSLTPETDAALGRAQVALEPSKTGEVIPKGPETIPGKSETVPKFEDTAPIETETGPGMVGMGAADRSEIKTYSENTGIKDASITDQRELRGIDPLERGEVQKWETATQEAQVRIQTDSTWLDRLQQELIYKPRPMDTTETAGMLTRLTRLRQEYDSVSEQLSKAFDGGLPTEELNARAQELSDQISATEGAVSIGGAASESGRSLNALKMMMAQDFTLAAMESRMRTDRGGAPLTAGERIQLIKDHEAIQEKLKDAELAESEARTKFESAEARAVMAELKASKTPEFHPSILAHAERFVSRMESKATEYAKEIFGQFNSPTPDVLAKAAFIGATRLARIGLDIAKWTSEMVKELGEGFRPYAEQVFEASKKVLDDQILADEKRTGEKGTRTIIKRKLTSDEKKQEIKSKIDIEIKSADPDISGLVQQLARQFVEDGITELEPLLDTLHGALKEIDPAIARRTVQDTFTGYGKTTLPSQDVISRTVAELKGQALETGKLLDLEEGKPLKATGFLRGAMSDVRRRLVAKVNEYKRRFGVVTSNAETQLKSALESRKTALRNQIKDLQDQIDSREKFIKKRTASPTDAEAEALKVQRDELKSQFDEIFTKPEMTDARRLELATAAAKQNEAMWLERLSNAEKGIFDTTKEPGRKVTSPELDAIRARIEHAKEQIKELHNMDEGVQQAKRDRAIETERKALEKQIAEQQRKLTEGDLDPVGKAFNRPHANPAIETLLQQRDELGKQLVEARKKPEAQKAAEALEKKVKSIEETITKRQAKLDAGDLLPSGKARPLNRPLPPELESARQRLDTLNHRIAAARKAARPVKTPEQIALQTLKTRIASETVKYLEKLAKGDYTATAKRPPFDLSKDPATMKAKAELEALKNKWLREGAEERTRNLKGLKKAADYALESMHLQQNVVSSFDLSALRQAAFRMLNPFRAKESLREIGQMIESLSKKRAGVIEQQIFNRPNARNGVYAQAKLRLLKLDETKYSLQDESIRGRWAARIPGIAASNRAFTTFLNLVRADSFDAIYASAKDKSTATVRALGAFVNDATGYGDLGTGKLGRMADGLSTTIWSPRLLASRFRLLVGASFFKGTAESRKIIAKEYAGTLFGMWALYQLASLAGFEIEDDPRSSSFGKLRDGDIYIDPMGGLIQVTVLASRVATGETVNQQGQTKVAPTYETIARFLRMKFRPSISAGLNAIELATKEDPKNVIGEEITAGSIAKELVTPMSLGDIYKLMEEAGVAKGTLYEIFQLFGAGLQIYNADQKR